jgi:hypothetical protein
MLSGDTRPMINDADVLIVGSGPTSLSAKASLATFGIRKTRSTYLASIPIPRAAERGAKARFDTESPSSQQDEDGVTVTVLGRAGSLPAAMAQMAAGLGLRHRSGAAGE